jgi:hypothetical protein
MRIFYAFLVILCAVLLFLLLPFTTGPHSFQTDLKEDSFTVVTADTNNATVQLYKVLYDDDMSSIGILSRDTDDIPLASSYNGTTRALVIIGLATNTTRAIDVTYEIDALGGNAVIGTILDMFPFFLIAICLMFIGGAIYLIIRGNR